MDMMEPESISNRTTALYAAGANSEQVSGLQRGTEKVPREIKNVPQRLKPHYEQSTCGTAEAMPLSKSGFFRTL
jgi:hypothetical protein